MLFGLVPVRKRLYLCKNTGKPKRVVCSEPAPFNMNIIEVALLRFELLLYICQFYYF